MAKRVRDTNAGQSISAWVILNRRGREVAHVQAYHGNSVTVDVYTIGDEAVARNMVAMGTLKKGDPLPYGTAKERAAYDRAHVQQGTAGGYGYDKLTAALSGLYIDGVRLMDHCEHNEPGTVRLYARYLKDYDARGIQMADDDDTARAFREEWEKKAQKIGARFANYGIGERTRAWGSLYPVSGLERLEMLGYRVIRAI